MSTPLLLVAGSVLGFLLTLYCIVMAWRSERFVWKAIHLLGALLIFISSMLELGQAQQPQNVPAPVSSTAHLIFEVSKTDQSVYMDSLQASTATRSWERPLTQSANALVSVKISNNVIYTIGCNRPDVDCIEAMRASDGSELWHTVLHIREDQGQLIFGKLIVTAGMLLVQVKQDTSPDKQNYLYALRLSDGVEAWHSSSANVITIADGNVYLIDNNFSTIKDQNVMSFLVQSQMKALRISDGAVVWHTGLEPTGATPVQLVAGNGLVLLHIHDEIRAWYALNGSFAWKTLIPQKIAVPNIALLILSNNNVYPQTGEDADAIIAVRGSDGGIVWSSQPGGLYLYVTQNHLYVQLHQMDGTAQLSALDAFSGRRIWQRSKDYFEPNALVEAGGVVYIVGNDSLHALRSNDGKLLWQRQEPMSGEGVISFSTPIVVNGVIFVAMHNRAARYDPLSQLCFSYCVPFMSINALRTSDGSLYWRYKVSDDLVTYPDISA